MLLFLFALAGIVISLAMNRLQGRKNPLQNVSDIRGLWFPIAGVLLELPFSYFPSFALQFAWILTTLSSLCVVAFLILNRRRALSVLLIAAGTVCNYCVIAFNHFRMPVSPAALAMYPGMTPEAVYAKKVNYFVATDGARLYFLGDIIPVHLKRIGGFFSVGDVLLGLGIMLFIISVLTAQKLATLPDTNH
jgi:hypothetical protein